MKYNLIYNTRKKPVNEWMCECVLVVWLSPCSRLTSLLWISGIFACFTLSVSPCLPPPPPLFSFVSLPPSSLHPAIQNQSTPHSDQREGAFFSLSLLLRRGSAGGREAACVPCCCVPVSLELCSTWISHILPFHMHAATAASHFSLAFFFMLHVSELWMFCCFQAFVVLCKKP